MISAASENRASGEPGGNLVGAAAVSHVESALESHDERHTADGAEALRHHVEQRAHRDTRNTPNVTGGLMCPPEMPAVQ
jgi:hypothetical protein